jgi:hypothetical protein
MPVWTRWSDARRANAGRFAGCFISLFGMANTVSCKWNATDVLDRRVFLARTLALLGVAAAPGVLAAAPTRRMTVYKDAGCGCCKAWISHMTGAGFVIDARDVPDISAIKRDMGVPSALASCHTGVIGSVLIEGHVPAAVVLRFLAAQENPKTRVAAWRGLAVPGMPTGSPGMEGPNPERYDVLAFGEQGRTAVFSREVGRATSSS